MDAEHPHRCLTDRESIHFHELVHVVQWSALGVDEFLLTYALGVAQSDISKALSKRSLLAFSLNSKGDLKTLADRTAGRRSWGALVCPRDDDKRTNGPSVVSNSAWPLELSKAWSSSG